MRQPILLSLVLAGSTFACVDNAPSSSPPDDTQTTADALEQADGGLDTTDEAPVFDDDAAFAAEQIEPDAVFTDAMAQDPSMVAMSMPGSTAEAHDVLLLWGRMPGDPLATDGRDWDGTLSLSRGGMLVRRTVAFEDRDQVMPRTAIDSLSFTSHTRPFVDGLALRVAVADPAAGAPVLTYTSASSAATYQFDLSQLAAGPIVVDAGNGFKMIAIAQHAHDTDGCLGGFMRGRFRALPSAAAQARGVGVYRGIVTNRLGEPIGHVRGLYGHKLDGTPVMFGKFIAHDGRFLGLIAGTYGNGDFLARWKERGDDDHGRVRGKYFDSATVAGGTFVARWAQTQCSQDQ